MRMPYGRFKGQEIEDLPSSYLKWIAENWDEKSTTNKMICKAADEEWQFREKTNIHWEKDRI
uniref:Putative quorum-sensing-regulated virulence factor n=1 Tax=viral metagenome TaxID=1070528 RepID=A0A6M3KNA5_9ZZZZ